MAKDDLRYVGHMVDCARRIEQFLGGKPRSEFDADEMLQLAVVHLLQTIGEAARLVSPEFRQRCPTIPWSQIVGMRHRIVHDYLNVDYDIAWEVSNRDVASLIAILAPLLPPTP
jgi:uncharacterized protein with HEPN domain